MSEFSVHSPETAPEGSRQALDNAQRSFGFVPNLIGMLAEAPAAAEAYLALGELFGGTSFSPVEQQVVLLATSFSNRCDYCMAAHSVVAGMQGVAPDIVSALRDGRTLEDSRLEALRRFTTQVVESRGVVDDGALDRFLAAGFERRQVLEVIVGVTMKTLSNYSNHVAETPLDEPFQSQRWVHPDDRAARAAS